MSDRNAATLATAFNDLREQLFDFQTDPDLSPRKEVEEVPTDEQVKAQKEKLNKIEKILLPSCRQQLVDLLEALDLPLKGTDPNPKFPEAVQLVKNFGPSLRELYAGVNALAPHIRSLCRTSSTIDQTYGVLKRFRLESLRLGVSGIISGLLPDLWGECSLLFSNGQYAHNDPDASIRRDQIISLSSNVFVEIDEALAILPRSDFGFLQIKWESFHNQLGESLAILTQQVNESTDDPAEGNVRSRIIQLMQMAIPLVKLARIFFRKLARNPPFTFDDKLPSSDLQKLLRSSSSIASSVKGIVEGLLDVHQEQFGIEEDVPPWAKSAKSSMSGFTDVLRTYLKPLDSDPSTSPEEIINDLFSLMKPQFFLACDKILAACDDLVADFPFAQ
ncbi:hypothetical protein PTTG_02901 [Puccinia triticina 1-1 BBBD Race 1]|uniref:Uncharacterized protein n=2 Tax=Puccinia triticina TaxID=208348 RepID=A0A0C4EQ46_PUCT1|nr:uncharacterized protein PtA15_1A953 [Puccinia triticina]OAV94096.1 hypothetical protein PTTG_02901 [Puccinia triticina 1-1 BBBD Race 1]WAQ81611.1 hypothetical protein PtA15_1A953 [Puccinia triticina]WAR52498.1 hypothetical protein PtB15_1B940 [Puccinia triticina]